MHEAKEDYQKLMSAVLRQAIDDYVKLQHPKHRQRKYEKEAFITAVDLFWDEEYLLAILDDESKFHTLKTLCMAASGRENIEIKNLRQAIVAQSKEYWKNKAMNTITIPEQITVAGHVYSVVDNSNEIEFYIDYDNKLIGLDLESDSAQQTFMKAVVDLTCYHDEIKTSAVARSQLSKALFQMFKVNNCFTGDF